METERAIKIIKLLAEGVDPKTGEIFPENSPYQYSETVRALYAALKALERVDEIESRKGSLPEHAGRTWTQEEEQQLIAAFENGKSINEIANIHGRTTGGITSRLVKLGKLKA